MVVDIVAKELLKRLMLRERNIILIYFILFKTDRKGWALSL